MRSHIFGDFYLIWRFGFFFCLIFIVKSRSYELNRDSVLLLSLKNSIISDPLHVLDTWTSNYQSPCSWVGVSCGDFSSDGGRVTGLALPNSQLLGSIHVSLGLIEKLQFLDLSNNSFNGSLPNLFFNALELRFLDLSNNLISGELPETVGRLQNLQKLNLSDNRLAGKLPETLTTVFNLTVVSLKNNYLYGDLPNGFSSVEFLDLSSNLINGSLPPDFGGFNLRYFNISYNRVSGKIPFKFPQKIPANATVDLSFNNLTGEIPESSVFMNQKTLAFLGNLDLCGLPTKNPCPISSSPSTTSPNFIAEKSPPAIAAIPRSEKSKNGLKPLTIVAIVVGDIAGIAVLAVIFCYVLYQFKKRKNTMNKEEIAAKNGDSWSTSSSESTGFAPWSCLRKRGVVNEKESDSSGSDLDYEDKDDLDRVDNQPDHKGTLVTVNGDKELELETLLKASAYILGATGSSIIYKAVLEDGTSLAVRRIGESNVDRLRDFETQVRIIAKLVHSNLVRLRGFFWGIDEKLIIYDFVPNGSLANARHKKVASSPCHFSWDIRLKIAKGLANGLAYLHDKKHVHGNLKPSNILLGSDLEPMIGDFGLERLITGDTSYKACSSSSRIFGSKRSTASRESLQDFPMGASPSPSPSSMGFGSPYVAPESLRNLNPNPKWDVYSFGVILLELLSGKIIVVDEMGQVNGLVLEDKNRALRMADAAIRPELEGKEEALLGCFKLGLSCACPVPQKRPTMREVVQILEKIPSSSNFYCHL